MSDAMRYEVRVTDDGSRYRVALLPDIDQVGVSLVDDEHLELSFWTADGRIYVAGLTRATAQVLVGMIMDKVVGTDD